MLPHAHRRVPRAPGSAPGSALLALTLALTLGTSGTARAESPSAPGGSPGPKVVVVVAGDPDAPLRQAGARLDDLVERSTRLRAPVDPGLRRALRGEPAPSEDDGLGRARATRRELGWGEDRDLPVLARIARMSGADAVVVVRAGDDGPQALVADPGAGAFYEGTVRVRDAADDALERFVLARARAAATRPRPERERPGAVPEASRGASGDSGGPTAAGNPGADSPEGRSPPEEERSWIARNWPYLVGALLLAGTVTFFVVRDSREESPQPMLRFTPGGE